MLVLYSLIDNVSKNVRFERKNGSLRLRNGSYEPNISSIKVNQITDIGMP